VRKDIEQTFCVLKAKWLVIAKPILLHSITDIGKRATAWFILHNMLVSNRVMGIVKRGTIQLQQCNRNNSIQGASRNLQIYALFKACLSSMSSSQLKLQHLQEQIYKLL
jgi:hypothetical protein